MFDLDSFIDKLISNVYWYCSCKQTITKSLCLTSKWELCIFCGQFFKCQYENEILEFNRKRTKLRQVLNTNRQKSFDKQKKYAKLMLMIKENKHLLKEILHDFNLEKEKKYLYTSRF